MEGKWNPQVEDGCSIAEGTPQIFHELADTNHKLPIKASRQRHFLTLINTDHWTLRPPARSTYSPVFLIFGPGQVMLCSFTPLGLSSKRK